MSEKKIESWLREFDPADLVLSAFRYFLGRMTIATCCFAQYELAKAWPELPIKVRRQIKKELEAAIVRDDKYRAEHSDDKFGAPLGMDCDRAAWMQVRAAYSGRKKPAGRRKLHGYLRFFDVRGLIIGSFRYHLGRTDKNTYNFIKSLDKVWRNGLPTIERNIICREISEELKLCDQKSRSILKYHPLGNDRMMKLWKNIGR